MESGSSGGRWCLAAPDLGSSLWLLWEVLIRCNLSNATEEGGDSTLPLLRRAAAGWQKCRLPVWPAASFVPSYALVHCSCTPQIQHRHLGLSSFLCSPITAPSLHLCSRPAVDNTAGMAS